ncbi:oxygenase MpaB family protein [Alteromonas gracilis]
MISPGWVRRQLAQALRSRVAGEDADARAAVIWGSEGPRRFSAEDPVWRVHADAAMFPGGIRALLLQSLHPLAMAGVAGHSGYRGDPWGRLARTSEFLAVTTFGTIEHADRAIARVRGIHRRVNGTADDGTAYAASDPHLLRWVHIAEVDSFLTCFQAYAAEPLDDAEADTYVAQAAVVAEELGVIDAPRDVASLKQALEDYRPELRATEACRDTARFLLLDPPLPLTARPGYGLLATGAVATLPGWARRELRLPPRGVWDLAGRGVGRVGTGVVRWAMADPSVARPQAG